MPCGADPEQVCCLEDWVALARRCRIAASTRTTTRIPDADAMLAVRSSLGYVDRIAHRRWLELAPKLVSDSAAITVSLLLFDDDTTVLCFRGEKKKYTKFTSCKAPSKDAGADLRRAGSRRLVYIDPRCREGTVKSSWDPWIDPRKSTFIRFRAQAQNPPLHRDVVREHASGIVVGKTAAPSILV
jgi:hypothetical protein